MNFRNDIQGLRGIAVLLVLFYHLYPNKLFGGFIGVDIFFVISGFLVCYSIENRIKNNKNEFYVKFYATRIRRLLPASLLTIWFVTYYIYRYDFTYFAVYKQDAIASLLIYANYNYYFNKVDYFHAGLKESLLLHYWSLSLEEQFYIISPMLVWIAFNHVRILYIILSIISLLVCVNYGYSDRNKGYFFLSSRSWEFLLGALVRYIPHNEKYNILLNSNISAVIIIIISMYYNDKMLYPTYNAIIPVLLSLYTLYCCEAKIILTNNIIFKIGNLSYSIYLIHFPLKSIYFPSILNYAFVLFVLVAISYNFVEFPFYKGIFMLSDMCTYIMAFIVVISTYINIIKLSLKSNNKLKNIKQYSSNDLIREFATYQSKFCCLKYNSKIYKSAILFIGDSHIQQYIIAFFNSEYKYKYQLLHIYFNSLSINKNTIINYIKLVTIKHNFSLCVSGNYYLLERDFYSQIYKFALGILPICKKVLLSNDNPRFTIDPNSCITKNKDKCYGEINKTCIIPYSYRKPNCSRIDVVKFWDNSIINENKCLFYYNYINTFPIYADKHHYSLLYLNKIATRVISIITKYVQYDKEYKYNKTCQYYQMANTIYYNKQIC